MFFNVKGLKDMTSLETEKGILNADQAWESVCAGSSKIQNSGIAQRLKHSLGDWDES